MFALKGWGEDSSEISSVRIDLSELPHEFYERPFVPSLLLQKKPTFAIEDFFWLWGARIHRIDYTIIPRLHFMTGWVV